MTRGRAATPDPFDLAAVTGSDELFEALSTRRLADLAAGPAGDEDPAAMLLAALVADVDAGAPPLPAPSRVACGMPGTRRRGVRAIVAFGVATLVLTSAGAAAAGGGNGVSAMRTTNGPSRPRGAERSNENIQRHAGAPGTPLADRRPRHTDDKRHTLPSDGEPRRALDDQLPGHRGHHPTRAYPPVDIHHHSPGPDRPTPSPDPGTPTPLPEVVALVP